MGVGKLCVGFGFRGLVRIVFRFYFVGFACLWVGCFDYCGFRGVGLVGCASLSGYGWLN